jgi:hypothetical protein
MSELTTKAVFRRNENEIEATDCVIDKVIRLSGVEFDSFSRNLLREWDFIRDNPVTPAVDAQGRSHCLLVTGNGRRDGILVNSEGAGYARYSAFLPDAADWLSMERFPALAKLASILGGIIDYIADNEAHGRHAIDSSDFEDLFQISADRTMLDVVSYMLEGTTGLRNISIEDGKLVFELGAPADTRTLQTLPPFEVLIQNAATPETDKVSGARLTLPASVGDLWAAFKEAGVQPDGLFRIAEVASPWDNATSHPNMSDSLDELNMLASFLREMEDFEIDKFRTLLSSGHSAVPRDAAGLINMLHEDNLAGFEIIDAPDFEALGRYWAEEKPDRFSFEEYGRILQREENGVFVGGSYIYYKYEELEPFYDGNIPDEYRIAEDALQGLNPTAPAIQAKKSDIDAYGYMAAKWLAAVERTPGQWREDARYRGRKDGALYYLGGEDGQYMRLANDGKLTVGRYALAKPGIADAVLSAAEIKDTGGYESAVLMAAQLGGARFLSDVDGMSKYTPPEATREKPSVIKQIREAKAAPKQPRKAKPPDKHKGDAEL